MIGHLHMGRAWTGHAIEDDCPCDQAACGLAVPGNNPDRVCDQHNPADWRDARTMRRIHTADQCPSHTIGDK